MPTSDAEKSERVADLLEKILVFQLFELGMPQERIAKTVGRQTRWVNTLLKGVTRRQ